MRRHRAALALLLVALLILPQVPPTQAQPVAQWQNITPPGVSLDYTNPPNNFGMPSVAVGSTGTVYAGTYYQGLYKSTNQGATWSKANTGQGGNALDQGATGALITDLFHPETLYTNAGFGGGGGPYKSTDGGVSWMHKLPGTNPVNQQIGTNDVGRTAVDPYQPDHLLVAFHYWWNQYPGCTTNPCSPGVIESFDGGDSWTVHYPPAGSNWGSGSVVSFLNNSFTWLLGSQQDGQWRTTDSGAHWTKISSDSTAHGNSLVYRSPTTGIFYTAISGGVQQSTDNGETWAWNIAGLPSAQFAAIVSDGVNLYTAPGFPSVGDNAQAHGPWYTLPENAPAGTSWQSYNAQTTCLQGVCNGPSSLAYDPVHGVIYAANFLGGVWKLQVGAGGPAPTLTMQPPATAPPATPGGLCYAGIVDGLTDPLRVIRGQQVTCPTPATAPPVATPTSGVTVAPLTATLLPTITPTLAPSFTPTRTPTSTPPGGTHVAIALLSNVSADLTAGSDSSAIDTTGANLLGFGLSFFTSAPTPGDSKSNTWTSVRNDNYFGQGNLSSFYALAGTVGTGHTFEPTGQNGALSVAAFSGVKATAALDTSSGRVDNFVSSVASNSVTPSEDNCLVLALLYFEAGTVNSINGGFTLLTSAVGGSGTAVAYLVQTTAAAAAPTWTLSTSNTRVVSQLLVFKAAAAGAQDTPELRGRPFGLHGQAQMHQLLSQ